MIILFDLIRVHSILIVQILLSILPCKVANVKDGIIIIFCIINCSLLNRLAFKKTNKNDFVTKKNKKIDELKIFYNTN